MPPDPFLAEVTRLVYRISDPRVLKHLRAENDPGRSEIGRARVIGERARQAGWPSEHTSMDQSRVAQRQALRRLEGDQYHDPRAVAARYKSRSRVTSYLPTDGTRRPSIYDE
jgi:hypothetical protein